MTKSKSIAQSAKSKVEIKSNVLQANQKLIAYTLIKERKNANEYLDLSIIECKQINALLIKKEKHYLPKTISKLEEKTYRTFNRNQFKKLDSLFLKGAFQKSESNIKYLQALRKFTIAHYNIDLKAIDIKTFDFKSIYSNESAMSNLKNVIHLM
jgi:hypothetical protein